MQIALDTSNILFVGSGAFNGLESLVKNRQSKGVSVTPAMAYGSHSVLSACAGCLCWMPVLDSSLVLTPGRGL